MTPEAGRRICLNQRLVKERDLARAHELRRVVFICLSLLVPVLFYVWQEVEYLRFGYRVEELRGERNRLQEWNRQLKLERATLLNLNRIESLARSRLGMVPPGPQNTVKVHLTGDGTPAARLAQRSAGVSGILAAER